MRLVVCGLSAVLLSGCSWLGGSGQSYNQKYLPKYSPQGQVAHQAPRAHNPCVVYSPVQPVPPGCDPSMVTLATGTAGHGGQMHGASYATGGYGSHAGQAGYSAHQPAQRLKKPRLRGALSIGVERSTQGSLIDFDAITPFLPSTSYDPTLYEESSIEGSPLSTLITTTYSSPEERTLQPTVSFDDPHTNPLRIAGGMEYVLAPKTTVFANAGYTHAEGNRGRVATVIGTLTETVSEQSYQNGAPFGAPIVQATERPNLEVAYYNYNFNDKRRYDFEVGARQYFNPIVKDQGFRTLTPFVGASAGVAHHNEVTATLDMDHLYLTEAWPAPVEEFQYYLAVPPGNPFTIYESAWLPNGSLTAGLEWQLTSGTAIALESGLKYEKSRDYIDGSPGDSNFSIPVTLRGSFNF